MNKALNVLSLVLFLFAIVACGQKKDDSSGTRSNPAGSSPVGTTVANNNINADENQFKGDLINLSNNGDIFDTVVKFMAPTFGAEYIGDIEAIQAKINIETQANGQVNLATSTLFIKITDSYAAEYGAIRMGFKATSGQVGANAFNVVFSDGARQITVVGSTNGSMIQGQVKFKTPQSGTEMLLGTFNSY